MSHSQPLKLKIDYNDLVILHRSDGNCTRTCVCFPLSDQAGTQNQDYICSPAPEMGNRHPVIESERLTHYFKKQHVFRNTENIEQHIYNQLSKKRTKPDRNNTDQLENAWGIFFEEDWHSKTLRLIIFLGILVSFVFGVI